MDQTKCFLVDSFADAPGTGNPAGVVFHDGGMSGEQMQALAGQIARESVFLSPAENADWQAAYYTGQARIPLCGHDTIAAVAVLARTERLPESGRVRFATDVGIVEGEFAEDGTAWMTQALPCFGKAAALEEVARALCVSEKQVVRPCQVVSTGTPFLLTRLRREADIDRLAPNMAGVTRLTQRIGAAGIYAWAESETGLIRARCFAPGAGLPEDPVTGSASGAMGAALCLRQGATGPMALALRVDQGCPGGRRGQAQVRIEAQAGKVTRVSVGGRAVVGAELPPRP